jgi:hypothetical protein
VPSAGSDGHCTGYGSDGHRDGTIRRRMAPQLGVIVQSPALYCTRGNNRARVAISRRDSDGVGNTGNSDRGSAVHVRSVSQRPHFVVAPTLHQPIHHGTCVGKPDGERALCPPAFRAAPRGARSKSRVTHEVASSCLAGGPAIAGGRAYRTRGAAGGLATCDARTVAAIRAF